VKIEKSRDRKSKIVKSRNRKLSKRNKRLKKKRSVEEKRE
jgi:hypothetical protein